MLVEFILTAVLLVLIRLLGLLRQKPANNGLPTGPTGIPIFGNLLQLSGNVAQKLTQWRNQYGNLYTIHMGTFPVVVLSDLKQIRELFGMMISTSRYNSDAVTICTQGSYGVGNARKDEWLEQKNFCVQSLRSLGFERETELTPLALQELQKICELIDKNLETSGKPIWLKMLISESTSRIYLPMINHTLDAASLKETFHIADKWMYNLLNITTTGIVFLPWLKYVAPMWSGYNAFKDAHWTLRNHAIKMFEARLKSSTRQDPPKDLIDAFINKVEKCEDSKSSFYKKNGWQHAYGSTIGWILGGSASLGPFITWAIYYLATHPDSQKKVQQEIDAATEGKRIPYLDDKSSMPILEGVMLEILRMTTIAATGTFHELEEDVHFHGYHLPKGQIITAFLHYIHNDKAVWGDPENFRPERYLGEAGGKLKEFVVAFQPGRRSCLGQRSAAKVGFLYLAVLLQKYSFEKDPSVPSVQAYLEPINPHIIWPKDLPILVKRRL